MKTPRLKIIPLIMIGLLAGCAKQSVLPPELLMPVSVKADTARVTRGNVEMVEQYKGLVRVQSDKLAFGNTGLLFGAYLCVPGQAVKEGELLARLDTEALDEQIEDQQKELARMRREYELENEALELDIAIAQIEMQDFTQTQTGFDEDEMRAAEDRRLDIERKRLTLTQARERQALSLKYAQDYLNELLTRAEGADLYAPYDGVITYMAEKWPGDRVEPYAPIIFISNEQEMFVEYSSLLSVSVTKNDIVKGLIDDREYDLERIPVSAQDLMYYNTLRVMAPLRFTIINPDEKVKPGAYVSIVIYTQAREDVLRIPTNALYSDPEIGGYVYVIEDGQKVIRTVEQGLRSTAYVEIKSGLSEGEEVYVK